MTKHTSLAIALTATTFLSAPATAAFLTPTLGENSVFAYSEGSESDYNFALQETDGQQNPNKKYYKIKPHLSRFSSTGNVNWAAIGEDQKDATDVIEVKLPNNQVKYFKYTYTRPEGRTAYNTRQDALSGNVDADFIGSSYETSYPGILYGGAVFNSGNIDSLSGNFIKNSINNTYNYGGTSGAAIANEGTIGKISGDFISNYLNNPKTAKGSAIINLNKIGEIQGKFIGNYIETEGIATGGAILNNSDGIINNINANFIGNYAKGKINVEGGAIYNQINGIIGKVTGDFISNYTENTADEENALGGAVSVNADMTFASGTKTHFISDNYTQDNIRGKIYNAFFMERFQRPTELNLTLDTTGGGTWVINDNIEGGHYSVRFGMNYDYQYKILMVGDGRGTVWVNNDIVNAEKITVDGTTLRFGSYQHEDRTAKNWDGKGAFVASMYKDADAVTSLLLNNAVFDIANGYLETVKLKGYSATDSFLHIDVDPDNMAADVLNVASNVEGVTKMSSCFVQHGYS